MKEVKVISAIILTVLVITGTLAVSGHAEKPPSPPGQSKPEPVLISVTGAIQGQGDPAEISVAFVDGSFGEYAGSYVANPDYPPALKVTGPGKHKRMRYYYCDHESHDSSAGVCSNSQHDPENYKCLTIQGGEPEKKTERVIFQAGSTWTIVQKIILPTGDWQGELVAEGTLGGEVVYEVLEWSS